MPSFFNARFLHASLLALLLLGSPSLRAASINPKVLLQTNIGQLTIELFPHEAPVTVKNFLENVDTHFYSDTIFHSVVPGFFIQGGGLTADFSSKDAPASIKNEAANGLKNEAFMVSMARAAAGDSATSQFFINIQSNPALNANGKNTGYAVFGKVIEGMDIVEKISLQPRGMYDKFPEAPNIAVRILKIERIDPNALPAEVQTATAPASDQTAEPAPANSDNLQPSSTAASSPP